MPRIFRAAPNQRGERRGRKQDYSGKWRRFSEKYRKRYPFCAECFRQGRLNYDGVVVDHKFPLADGGELLPGSEGLWTLCPSHHAWKTALERYARETGQLGSIVRWCDDPDSRPRLRGEI